MRIKSFKMRCLTKKFHKKRVRNILFEEPIPIIFSEKRIMLLWSAKAGCTFAVKWMFEQMGLNYKDEITTNTNWVQRYRMNSYCNSKQHLEGVKLFVKYPDSFKIIKIVDDPFKRAVRSYIHACIHKYEDTKITSFLQREINFNNRFSFREFTKYLETINITECNVHHRCQIAGLEQQGYSKPPFIVRLENSMEEISHLEKLFKLDKVNLSPLRVSNHHRPKMKTTEFVGDKVMNEISGVRNAMIPEYKQFYDEEIINTIFKVYYADFEQYDYKKIIK